MASVRARRTAGHGRSRYQAPPPPRIPRLALMKLQGARRVAESFKGAASPRAWGLTLAGVILMTGAAAAGAAWIGGSLVDAREAMADAADGAAAGMGFKLARIEVAGAAGARADEVRGIVLPAGRSSLFSASPAQVRARVEALDWVERARVRRLWPQALAVEVERREAYALWQHDGRLTVIDADGAPVPGARWGDHRGLPLVVGAGAAESARPILIALEDHPEIRERLEALVRVGERRWTINLKSGMEIALPAEGAPEALAAFGALEARHRLLDRPLARIDLRQQGKLIVLPGEALAGGPGHGAARVSVQRGA